MADLNTAQSSTSTPTSTGEGSAGEFTEMGRALDAAHAARESSSHSTSTTSTPSSSGSGSGSGGNGVSSATDTKASDGQGTGGSGKSVPVPASGPTDSTSQSHAQSNPSSAAGVNPDKNGKDGTPSPSTDPVSDRKKWNQWQAQRRIAAKEEKRRRYEEERRRLESEHARYSEAGGEYENPQMAAVKEDQLRELEIARVREAQQQWEEEAYATFSPEDAATFIEDSKKLSDWLNNKEPELLSYIDRPYGKHLLKGWMDKIAKNREASAKWSSLNSYEKYRVIDAYYAELEKFGREYAEGKHRQTDTSAQPPVPPNQQNPSNAQTQTQPVRDVPVPNSGRDSNAMPPSDNFALMLQDAMNKRGLK